MADWGNIPNDIATTIAEHLIYLEDFEAFGCVCSRWRSGAKQAKFGAANIVSSSPMPRPPWLMLPEVDDTSTQRRFYSLYNRKLRSVNLPLSSNPNSNKNKIRLLSSHGWLLSVTNEGKNLCLFNPLSGAVINLPKVRFWRETGLFYYDIYNESLFEKFILSGNPSSSSDFKIALVLTEPYPNLNCRHEIISFWRNGDDQWQPLEEKYYDFGLTFCNDITFYKGNFYGVDDCGTVYCFELDLSGYPHEQVVAKWDDEAKIIPHNFDDYGPLPDDPYRNIWKKRTVYYLVESDSCLLLVCRVRVLRNKCFRTVSFEVFELNVDNGEAKRVSNLGNVAIFVGWNSSFSTKASSFAPGIQHNSIYFTDDFRLDYYHDCFGDKFNSKGVDMGMFHLTDASFHKLFRDGPSHFSEYAPYMWLENPSF